MGKDGEKVLRTLSILAPRHVLATLFLFVACSMFMALPVQAASKYAGIVIDAKTGKTLYSYKADATRYPASLTKMMTMYMMFEALDSGKLNKKTRIVMSKYAASKPPSKLGIKPGRSIAAEHAILALATKSANDVAAAVAEHLGGSEANFAKMMTKKAKALGMSRTTFKNASGLTARGQTTTARDMARLGIALREHYPQYYKYFSRRNFKYGKANYRNHNRLLGTVRGVDGIKTGYTRASGFNLVSSVQSGNRSIVAVVIGGRSGKSRNAQMRKLIANYLPKATKRKKTQLIARAKTGNIFVASAGFAQLPKRGPLPNFRARPTVVAATQPAKQIDVSKPVVLASAVPTARPAQYKPKFNAQETVDIETRLAYVPVETPRSKQLLEMLDRQITGGVSQSQQLSVIASSSKAAAQPVSKPRGWVVQIAAAESEAGAITLLKRAQVKVPGVLQTRSQYTETVEKNGTTLYRARFAGFAGKSEARSACNQLKKRKISCLALNAG